MFILYKLFNFKLGVENVNGKEIFLYFVCDLYNFKNIYLLILWFKIFKLKKIKRII